MSIHCTGRCIAAEFYTELENPEHSLAAMLVYGISAYLVSVVSGKFILDV
ncbi:MAG: hypothetical protein IKL22_13480 [Lachnospiraceae bacterium]|nr:hypothetical protein [Lachnospiraceae bacterium]